MQPSELINEKAISLTDVACIWNFNILMATATIIDRFVIFYYSCFVTSCKQPHTYLLQFNSYTLSAENYCRIKIKTFSSNVFRRTEYVTSNGKYRTVAGWRLKL